VCRLLAASLFALMIASVTHASPKKALPDIERFWPATDFESFGADIDWNDVKWGGVPKDGIPSIDAPVFAPTSAVDDLDDREPVVGLEIDGNARGLILCAC